MPAITATLFNDPGCPWGYCFRPAHARLIWRFGDQVQWQLVMIGLSETAEAYERRGYSPARLSGGWPAFERRFGMPFGYPLKPRMAGTSRGCRAVVAARAADPALADPALRALQLMNFTTAGLLDSDDDLRRALAAVGGLDADAIVAGLDGEDTLEAYEADRALARRAEGTPTHAQGRHATSDGPVRYTAPSVVFEDAGGRSLEVGGFQPFEAYDTAIANLDPALERRPEPADAHEALAGFEHGLTTAEVAAVMRTDLGEADLAGATAQLFALAGAGSARNEPHGGGAMWHAA